MHADIAVLGAGFGGSLMALVAQRCGLRPVLLERARHPRFALGESSTPLANLALEELAARYDLPRLRPLAEYGSWRRTYPHLRRGLKRGFSYFHHRAGRPFAPRDDHANELLVAANPDVEHGDTHWLRCDIDHFLVDEARRAGVPYFDLVERMAILPNSPWTLNGTREGEPLRVTADFVIDASGDGGALAQALGLANDLSNIRTNSRAVYSHFRGVRRWRDEYEALGGAARDHPFACDDAALHHVFDGGWMWVLRFDHGVVSAGFSLDAARFPPDPGVDPEEEWRRLLERFPSIRGQFERAEPVLPVQRSGRLQRRRTRAAGPDWAMLPTAAGLIDALHSSGNAHTLSGVERLARILAETLPGPDRTRRLEEYGRAVLGEVELIDRLVHGCYAGFERFERMAAYSMLYFAAATFSEHARRGGDPRAADGFLQSHDPEFRSRVADAHQRMIQGAEAESPNAPGDAGAAPLPFVEEIGRIIEPYNVAGLCDPGKRNMYPFVA